VSGRGKSLRNIELIATARNVLEEIQPASVRAVSYQLFNRKLIESMAKSQTNRVSTQLVYARETGFIPWDWIVDETREAEYVRAWKDPAAFVDTVRRAYRRDRWVDQPIRLEVWSEKGTVRGTLEPVLAEYGVTFRVMHGYSSATTLHDIAVLSVSDDRPFKAIYAGDFDCSGVHMSQVDLPSRLDEYGGRVEIVRVALTKQHCRALGTAPSFLAVTKKGNREKKGDPRYNWFVSHHGDRCWELDALNPVDLRQAVEDEIRRHIDWAAWNRATLAERAEKKLLANILNDWPGISEQATEYGDCR
jgi:hypothetical protein